MVSSRAFAAEVTEVPDAPLPSAGNVRLLSLGHSPLKKDEFRFEGHGTRTLH